MLKKSIVVVAASALFLSAISLGVTQTLAGDDGVKIAATTPVMAENGLHTQSWFFEGDVSFPQLMRSAAADNKGLVVLVEQPGCHYCAELHEVNFAKVELTDYMRQHFLVVQLNLLGENKVVDFDGKTMSESDLTSKWGVRGTPTTLVFAKNSENLTSRREAENFRLPGYIEPFYYMSALKFLISDAYNSQSFQEFVEMEVAALKAKGGNPETW